MPRTLVHEGDTLADALKANGYRAIYATDEVRFANFDASYGFDETITPPIGASDFVIGAIGDQPLVNLVAGSPLGAVVFPQIYANRADATTYEPRQFLASPRAQPEERGTELSRDSPHPVTLALRPCRASPADHAARHAPCLSRGADRSRPPVRRRARAAGAQGLSPSMLSSSCSRITARRSATDRTRWCARPGRPTTSGTLSGAMAPAWSARTSTASCSPCAHSAKRNFLATPDATTGRSRWKTCDRPWRNSPPAMLPKCRRHLARSLHGRSRACGVARRPYPLHRDLLQYREVAEGQDYGFRRCQRGRHLLRDWRRKAGGCSSGLSACPRSWRRSSGPPYLETRSWRPSRAGATPRSRTCTWTAASRSPGVSTALRTAQTDPEAARLWDGPHSAFPRRDRSLA